MLTIPFRSYLSKSNTDTITYRYAPDGSRVMKTLTPKITTNPTRTTIYMDDDYESETVVIPVQTGIQSSTTITTRTRVMLGSVHISTIEKSNSITSRYYQLTNPTGSSTITTDDKGVVIQTYDTNPYGNARINIETKPVKEY